MLTADEVKFLKELQDELNTQETFCQADPRFWVVRQDRWYACPEDHEDRIRVSIDDGCAMALEEGVKEAFTDIKARLGDDTATEWLHDWCIALDDRFDDWPMNSRAVNALNDYASMCDVPLDVVYEQCHSECVPDTMFLTYRECCEHIKKNDYHYENPRPYAMTAWRSPQVEKLIKILRTADFDGTKERKGAVGMSEKKYLLTESELRRIASDAASAGSEFARIDDIPSVEWLDEHEYHERTFTSVFS